jgi:hypothetical protein
LLHPVPSLTLYTNSSLQGLGAFLEVKSVSGVWSLVQQQEHINLLEMRAVEYVRLPDECAIEDKEEEFPCKKKESMTASSSLIL